MTKTLFCILMSLIVASAEAREATYREWVALKKVETFYKENKMQDIVDLLEPLAVRADPHEAIFSYLGIALIHQGKDLKAYVLLNRATQIYPENCGLQYNLGITAMRLEKYQAAITAFAVAGKIQGKKNEDTSQTVFYRATAHYMLKQYERAIMLIVPRIQDMKSVTDQWMQLAVNCYMMQNAWEEAEKILSQWIEWVPENSRSWQMLGDIFLQQEKYKNAAGAYEMAVFLGNTNISPGNLFAIYRYLYCHSEAARWAAHPEIESSHWLEHAKALYQAADFNKALELVDREPKAFNNPEALILRGKSLSALGKRMKPLQRG